MEKTKFEKKVESTQDFLQWLLLNKYDVDEGEDEDEGVGETFFCEMINQLAYYRLLAKGDMTSFIDFYKELSKIEEFQLADIYESLDASYPELYNLIEEKL